MAENIEIEAYDIKSFCKAYNVSRSFVYTEMKSGRLKFVKVGRRTLIPKNYAEEWLYNRGSAAA